mmetsp:Transcript_13423/g.32339  ORF Transcript_13423/g.32339 Transcript_13423/m.32339 type:complete len:113 (-) Transcript_13423:1180-1518(-)
MSSCSFCFQHPSRRFGSSDESRDQLTTILVLYEHYPVFRVQTRDQNTNPRVFSAKKLSCFTRYSHTQKKNSFDDVSLSVDDRNSSKRKDQRSCLLPLVLPLMKPRRKLSTLL